MPTYVRQYVRYLDLVVKGALAPYMTEYETSHVENKIEVELNFDKKSQTVDMILTSDEEEIKYNDIRLPEQLRNIIPVVASTTPSKISSAIMGAEIYPKCKVGQGIVESFDKKSYHYELDDCFHVLSAETQHDNEYAVLAKESNEKKEMKFFVSGSKLTVEPSEQYSESRKEYEIEFDGERIELERNEKKELRTRGQGHYCKLWR